LSSRRTRIPDLDRPVARSRDNLGPIRGKRDREDAGAVGAGALLCYTVDERRDHPVKNREEESLRLHACNRQHGDMGTTTRLQARRALEVSQRRHAAANRMRGIACGVWLRSSSRTERRIPLRESAQLPARVGRSRGNEAHGAERREADWVGGVAKPRSREQ
jgi:hypothetical protein